LALVALFEFPLLSLLSPFLPAEALLDFKA
jgi:hypothetical protein